MTPLAAEKDRSIEAVVARLRFGDSDGDDHDIAAAEIEFLDALLSIAQDRNAEHCAEVQRLQRDLEIQAVNATAVLQAQHERDCAVETLAALSAQLSEVADVMAKDGRFPNTVNAIRAILTR